MSGDGAWPPSAESLLPLLGLSESAEVVTDVGAALRPGRGADEAQTLVDRTLWIVADRACGVVVRSTDRVLQVAVAAPGGAFSPFARVHWADLPRDVTVVAAVVAPLCRSAEQLHGARPATP
ncbi:MAG: hypothetical protein ACRDQE_11810 [Gaiellales bacterium]